MAAVKARPRARNKCHPDNTSSSTLSGKNTIHQNNHHSRQMYVQNRHQGDCTSDLGGDLLTGQTRFAKRSRHPLHPRQGSCRLRLKASNLGTVRQQRWQILRPCCSSWSRTFCTCSDRSSLMIRAGRSCTVANSTVQPVGHQPIQLRICKCWLNLLAGSWRRPVACWSLWMWLRK